jgi:hypothetical protein
MADEKKVEVDNNLQGNLGDSPDVDLPAESGPEEKVPSAEISQWEKSLQTPNIDEVKGPENSVEKTMDLLAEKGQEAGGSKKDAGVTPDRIKVGGHVYKKVVLAPTQIRFRGATYELVDED